jgi:signal transduction histidine kinase
MRPRVRAARRSPRLAVVAALALAGCAPSSPEGILTIEDARLRLERAPAASVPTQPPDLGDGRWTEVSLPDSWRVARRRIHRDGWYRMTFELPELPREPWSIYLPRLSMNAAVYLNGSLVGTGGSFAEPVTQRWNDPLRLDVPVELLRTGENVVHVWLRTNRGSLGILFPIQVGATEQLRPLEEDRRFRQVNASRVLSALVLAAGLLLLTIHLRAGETPVTLWFALGAILFSVNSSGFWVRDLPMSARAWQWLMATSLWASVFCFLRATNHWLGRDGARAERVVLTAAASVAFALAVADDIGAGMVVGLSALCVFTAFVYLGIVLVRAGLGASGARRRWAIVPGAGLLLLVAHDAAMLVGPENVFETFLYPYAVPLALLLVGAAVVGRYAKALREAATLNRELERRVAEKSAELERNYRRLGELEAERAVAAERERLTQEMHDGIGGQLVSTLAMVQSRRFTPTELEEALADSIDDLRMMIESLEPTEGDLAAVLGAIRPRLERRLERHGLHFDWRVQALPALPAFGPVHASHVLRILQEAVTNVVRHAGATTITVRTGAPNGAAGPAGVFLEIADDGHGFEQPATRGRGLTNMQRRAEAIGGRLEVTSSDRGTEVRLVLGQSAHG